MSLLLVANETAALTLLRAASVCAAISGDYGGPAVTLGEPLIEGAGAVNRVAWGHGFSEAQEDWLLAIAQQAGIAASVQIAASLPGDWKPKL